MRVVSYYCPATGKKVDGWVYELDSDESTKIYDVVGCTACQGIHLVNLTTSKALTGQGRRGGGPPPRLRRRATGDYRKNIANK
ncbi:MAG: hypothetical protein E6G97_16810 [Alphaproteobacteria bacterium]|nr:MAG: hypothetical protein E6G97_16810 [Alphaproteobacteria bacterium]